MNRRNFLKFIVIGGAAALAAPVLLAKSQPDVRGWRFGVWTIVNRYGMCHVNPDATLSRRGEKYYWCRCDCGAEQAIRLDRLLGVDALSCAHVQHRGFFCVSPDTIYCQNCGGRRRFFFNGQGFRIFRCGNCEETDIRAWLRYEYGPASSLQFSKNIKRSAP